MKGVRVKKQSLKKLWATYDRFQPATLWIHRTQARGTVGNKSWHQYPDKTMLCHGFTPTLFSQTQAWWPEHDRESDGRIYTAHALPNKPGGVILQHTSSRRRPSESWNSLLDVAQTPQVSMIKDGQPVEIARSKSQGLQSVQEHATQISVVYPNIQLKEVVMPSP